MGGRRLRSFFTALQFLTRIHLVEQRDLTAADFGRSTRCFPLVGAVLGALYLLAAWLLGAWRGACTAMALWIRWTGFFPVAAVRVCSRS